MEYTEDQYREFYRRLEKLFGKGARTYRFNSSAGHSIRYLCIPGEDHRPLTDEENKQYDDLVHEIKALRGTTGALVSSGIIS